MFDLFYRNRRLLVLTIALIMVAGVSASISCKLVSAGAETKRNSTIWHARLRSTE